MFSDCAKFTIIPSSLYLMAIATWKDAEYYYYSFALIYK